MSKIKAGDKVRILGRNEGQYDQHPHYIDNMLEHEGSTAVVGHINSDEVYLNNIPYLWNVEWLEKIYSKEDFQIYKFLKGKLDFLVSSQDDWDHLMQRLEEETSLVWIDGGKPTEVNFWNVYKEQTVVTVLDNALYYIEARKVDGREIEKYLYESHTPSLQIYIAGSLFSEAEVEQRITEEKYIEHELTNYDLKDIQIFNPITNPFNDKTTNPTAEEIFRGDTQAIKDSQYILLNLDNQLDAGVFVELGQLVGFGEDKSRKIYPVISDIRVATAAEYSGERIPWGINTYAIGALYDYDPNIKFFNSSSRAIEQIVMDINNDLNK